MTSIVVPEVVRNKARRAGAQWWLDELADLVDTLADEWALTIGAPFGDATEALVLAATQQDGTPAVLKLIVPQGDLAVEHELSVLRIARGHGCVALLREDAAHGALLLERLGPSLSDLALPLDRRHEIMCTAAQQLWRPAPDCALPTGAAKARQLIDAILQMWEEQDHVCSARAINHAIWCAGRRYDAHDDERAVLVHGDVHQWNTLQAGDGFKLIDPDGLVAEPEYDLGIIMREDPLELMAGDPFDRALRLAGLTGCDATAIWEWGVVERVSTGLLGSAIGLQPVAGQMLDAANAIAARWHGSR